MSLICMRYLKTLRSRDAGSEYVFFFPTRPGYILISPSEEKWGDPATRTPNTTPTMVVEDNRAVVDVKRRVTQADIQQFKMNPASLVGKRFVHVMDYEAGADGEQDLQFTVTKFTFSLSDGCMFELTPGSFVDQSDQGLMEIEQDGLVDMLSESVWA
jgi:hypothetical protein